MENNYNNHNYRSAQKRVKEMKGFYGHLLIYLVINIGLFFLKSDDVLFGDEPISFSDFSVAFFWGIGLAAHWASVFGQNIFFGKRWEERKIKELMEKEKTKKWE